MNAMSNTTRAIKLGGLEYRAGGFGDRQYAALNRWLREAVPSPIAVVKTELEGLSESERIAILVRAYESMEGGRWPIEWGSPIAKLAMIHKPGGREAFVGALLGEAYPNLTPEQIGAIARSATIDELGHALAVAEGIDAMVDADAMVDPQAMADQSMSRQRSGDPDGGPPATSDSAPVAMDGRP